MRQPPKKIIISCSQEGVPAHEFSKDLNTYQRDKRWGKHDFYCDKHKYNKKGRMAYAN